MTITSNCSWDTGTITTYVLNRKGPGMELAARVYRAD